MVFSELADNKNVWVLVMYFPKLEIISNIFSVLDHGLCFNPSILQFTSMDPKQNFLFRWECPEASGSAFRWSVSEGKRRALLEVTCLSLPFHLFFGLSCVCFEKSRPQLWTGFLTVGAKTMHRIGRSDLPNDAPPPLQVWPKVK